MGALIRFANWVMRVYFDTPKAFRWIYFALPVVYFLFPFDLILDKLGLLGRLDDLVLILLLFWAIDRAQQFRGFHRDARSHGKQEQATGSAESPPEVKPPHEVLGVARGASKSEIKKAYRKLMALYHPDKFTHLGPDFEITAQRRTQEIIDAYQQLVR
ncbi:MAG: J domain-containing protein [Acidobacteriota bacterium]|nr:J domain-containing protein [Acidobacteriota bacterium]